MLRVVFLFILLLVPSVARAEKRVALVMGNAAYKETAPLTNTRNDAADMIAVLKRLGFEVLEGIDLDKRAMERLIRQFDQKLAGSEIALFFYAGHGLQVSGQNYLVPIDARLAAEGDVDFESLPLSLVLTRMERVAKTSLVLLDACRDNPLARNLARTMGTRTANVGQGLAEVRTGVGTLISFSTQPGNVALDGGGRNSPYTAALLKQIEAPGRDILSALAAVRGEVVRVTNGKQVPWEHTSLLGPVVLNAAAATAAPAGALPSKTTAQLPTAAPVTECDRLAALRYDPAAVAPGVERYQLDHVRAITACVDAVSKYPSSARLAFQLGRAYYAPASPRPSEAAKWFRQAAENDYAPAMTALGFMYREGRGLAQNDQLAVEWFRKAIEKGEAQAMQQLGLMHRWGRGVPQDDHAALRLFHKSLELGFAQGANALGDMHRDGHGGLAKNDIEAVRYYRLSAEAENPRAMCNLGNMLMHGRGVGRDAAEAERWLRRATDIGKIIGVKCERSKN